MTDYVLHDEKGNVVQKGSHAQVLQYLAAQAQESRWSSLARHDANERRRVLTRDIGIFDAACREFNRAQDNLKSVMCDSSSAAQRYLALREQEFDTPYDGAQAPTSKRSNDINPRCDFRTGVIGGSSR